MSAHLSLQDIAIRYARKTIVENISFELAEGEIGCLLGPSGCGKTTLLRTIAGFERPVHGVITLRNNQVASPSFSIPPEQRRVGMVFQDFALFPHLTIEQNIAFGLHQLGSQQQQQRVDALLDFIGLIDTKKRYPHQLSGGQQQRIALARALAPKPDILLLDEPFSNLDVELREHLAHDVRQQIKAEQVTAILVTHDQQEAFATADKIGLLNAGKLIQWGTANELYNQPNSIFSAEFIGHGSLISGEIKTDVSGQQMLHTELGKVTLPADFNGQAAKLLIRPDQLTLIDPNAANNTPDKPTISVRLINKSFRGGHYLCTLETANKQQLIASLPTHSTTNSTTNSPFHSQIHVNAQLLISVELDSTTPITC
ncbi:MAG: iron ABC transporter ATP-binding protein [Moraxellaceae bacterium]|nr:MAG: iron ABC transporter ATP-binding protein [Moraxellaceae bacterium]